MAFKRVKFVHNFRSGFIRSPLLIRKIIEITLEKATFQYEFFETKYRGHAHEMAKQAESEGFDAVVAVGGDGTANEVASALLYSPVAMGLIPIGSGNGLARGLNIPVSVRRSAKLLLEGHSRQIDAGCIEGRYFFVVTGLGFDALVGKLFDDRSLRGPLPYFYIGVREFLFYKPEVFNLRFNDTEIQRSALLVTVANTRQWGNGVIVAPKAECDDGLLDICIIHHVTLLKALYHFPKLFTGKIDRIREYERYQAQNVEIIRQSPGPYHVDGEPGEADLRVKISVKHKALRIVAPPR